MSGRLSVLTLALLTACAPAGAQSDLPPGPLEWKNRNPLHAIDLVRFRERARILRDISAFDRQDRMLTGGTDPQVVSALVANASLFRLLKDQPAIGRAFTEEEEEQHVPDQVHEPAMHEGVGQEGPGAAEGERGIELERTDQLG